MKSLFVLPLTSAGLLLAAGMANGQDRGTDMQPRGRAFLEQSANQSAQDATDMSYSETGPAGTLTARSITNASYGGTSGSGSEAGSPQCPAGPQCNIFRGR
ncbi:hypothetical protein [Paraburkholderia sp. BCC1885]|jgi:hypothetical protein|uniref:hypothetical protein n=1 Tax=Paraburkholderia sp. BCC1885 TaxID=2562669 RepID=UPI0011828E92|nr:hypothetical protein [Paraburkholderia sp. BCC1885]